MNTTTSIHRRMIRGAVPARWLAVVGIITWLSWVSPAHAAQPTASSWNLTDGASQPDSSYRSTLANFRSYLGGNIVYGAGTTTVTTGVDDTGYVMVTVYRDPDPNQFDVNRQVLHLYFRADDIYLVGYNVGHYVGAGGQQITGQYHYFPGTPPDVAGDFATGRPIQINYNENYNSIEGVRAANQRRRDINYRRETGVNHFLRLVNTGTTQQDEARALLWFAQVYAEGARFRYMSDLVTAWFDGGQEPTQAQRNHAAALQNDWDPLTTWFNNLVQNPTTGGFNDNARNIHFAGFENAARELAVLRYWNGGSPRLP
jgi:Ribosome inactivating protein